MLQLFTLAVGGAAAVGLLIGSFQIIGPVDRWPYFGGAIAGATILLSAALPTWIVGRLHRSLSRAHLLAYFLTLISLFVVIGLMTMELEISSSRSPSLWQRITR